MIKTKSKKFLDWLMCLSFRCGMLEVPCMYKFIVVQEGGENIRKREIKASTHGVSYHIESV